MLRAPDGSELHDRTAGRGLILNAEGRVLMLRGVDPEDTERGGFWWTPGGGIQDGESIEAGTVRELWEEVGFTVDELGPIVLQRVDVFPFGGRWIRQTETFHSFFAPTDFEPTAQAWEEIEVRAIREIRWLSPTELRQLDEPHFPRCLADLVEHLVTHGHPDTPWQERPSPDA